MKVPDKEFEKFLVDFRNVTSRVWWNLYQGCLETGFDEKQSFSLVQTYILAQNPFGIRPGDTTGPKPDILE